MAPSLRSGWTRLLAETGRGERTSDERPEFPVERPVPIPAGSDLASLEAMFRSYSVNGEPEGHLDHYVQDSFWRFLHTWGLVRHERGHCLEIGANPYFTTLLLDLHSI